MANMEHVQIVKRGRDAVARWREQNPGQPLDLNASYMSYARIPQVDLSGSDLRNSDLMGASLQRAKLSDCFLNPCHLYRANLTQAVLHRALLNGANLRGANLQGADLSSANLDRAILSDANLTGANLSGTNLSRANLDRAILTDANLTGAALNRTALVRTNLTNANLQGCDLYEAVVNDAVVVGAKFDQSIVGYTVFQNCDLRTAEGLDLVRHDAPSTIGVDTIFRSGGRIPETFLRGAGAPESLAAFQRSLLEAPPLLGDCFIACAAGDLPFAQSLQTDLQGEGIRCWLFPENARGNPLVERHSSSDQEEVERWVRFYDKLVVVCSASALESETIRNDITQAQERQKGQDKWLLCLVTPDDTMVKGRGRLARTLSSEHVVFDLRVRDSSPDVYRRELVRLADSLKQTRPAAAGIPPVQQG